MSTTPSPAQDSPPSPNIQRLGAILWPSFFAAGVATSVCFALVDPLALRDISFPNFEVSRELGYTLGFFAFWLLTVASSSFTWLLLRPGFEHNRPLPEE
jgi:hypothetical protein